MGCEWKLDCLHGADEKDRPMIMGFESPDKDWNEVNRTPSPAAVQKSAVDP